MQVWSLGWEDLLEKEMATHSSILAWKIPWTEDPGGLYNPWGHKESYTTERLTHATWLYLLITFCFSFIGLCFALNKNHMKTQSYGTRYAAPPWNSSITFLVFYLCKQKCSSNQCRLNCLKSAVGISVNWSFFLTSLRYRYSPKGLWLLFFPFLFFKIIYLCFSVPQIYPKQNHEIS